MNGTTKNTRLMGCGYLYPHVIPDPYTNTIALRNDDEFVIIANRGLWHHVSYTEAVEEIYETGNPVVAAKQLQDMAQAYGCKENLSILVVRLNTDKGPSLARLRQNRSMSIDDVEAAVKHEAKLQKHWQRRAAKQRQHRGMAEHVQTTLQEENPPPPKDYAVEDMPVSNGVHTPSPPPPPKVDEDLPDFEDNLPLPPPDLLTPEDPEPSLEQASLKPLPNQRYLKKTAATEWEVLLQSRLSQEVKDLEMKQFSSSVLENLGFETYDVPPSPPPPNRDITGSIKGRQLTTPWSNDDRLRGSNSPLLRETSRQAKKRGSIANTIAMFENMNPEPRKGGGRSVSVPRERVTSSPVIAHPKRPRSPPLAMTSPHSSASPFQAGQPNVSLEHLAVKSPSSPVLKLPPKPLKSSLRVKKNGIYETPLPSKVTTPSPKVLLSPSKAASPLKAAIPASTHSPSNDSRPNVSHLVKMFGTPSPGKLNERVEVEHVDDSGSIHVYEVAKL